jgi:hypothetical protein
MMVEGLCPHAYVERYAPDGHFYCAACRAWLVLAEKGLSQTSLEPLQRMGPHKTSEAKRLTTTMLELSQSIQAIQETLMLSYSATQPNLGETQATALRTTRQSLIAYLESLSRHVTSAP